MLQTAARVIMTSHAVKESASRHLWTIASLVKVFVAGSVLSIIGVIILVFPTASLVDSSPHVDLTASLCRVDGMGTGVDSVAESPRQDGRASIGDGGVGQNDGAGTHKDHGRAVVVHDCVHIQGQNTILVAQDVGVSDRRVGPVDCTDVIRGLDNGEVGALGSRGVSAFAQAEGCGGVDALVVDEVACVDGARVLVIAVGIRGADKGDVARAIGLERISQDQDGVVQEVHVVGYFQRDHGRLSSQQQGDADVDLSSHGPLGHSPRGCHAAPSNLGERISTGKRHNIRQQDVGQVGKCGVGHIDGNVNHPTGQVAKLGDVEGWGRGRGARRGRGSGGSEEGALRWDL